MKGGKKKKIFEAETIIYEGVHEDFIWLQGSEINLLIYASFYSMNKELD